MHEAHQIDLSTAEEMLQLIPAPSSGDYIFWSAIGRSLASEFGNDARDIFISWSNPSASTKERKSIISQWKTFVRNTKRFTIGTLIHHAIENGWEFGERRELTPEEKAQREAARAQRAKEQAAKQQAAELERLQSLQGLEQVFNNLPDYTGINSGYLNDKRLQDAHQHCVLKRGRDVSFKDKETDEWITVYRDPDQVPNKGERKGKTWTAWALYDAQGQFFGFERLYDQRDHNNKTIKRVARDTASNRGWHTFGTPETAKQIFVMGGFADALSGHLATGATTVAVVGEGNIPAVVAALKAAYPHAKVIAAPDNDKAGLEAAQSAGGFWTVPMNDGNDWSDVYLEHGPAELQHQLLNFVRGFEVNQVEQRYLNVAIREGLNLIKSAKGTGKSYSIAKHVKAHPEDKTLVISYRVLLNQALAEEFEADFYKDLIAPAVGDELLKNSSRLVMQLDSIWRLAGSYWETVFVDEIDQVLQHINSSSLQNKTLVLDVFTHILRNAKTVILADADMSELTRGFCNKIGLTSGVYTVNTHKPREDSVIYLYESKHHLEKAYTDYIEQGSQAFFCSNSKAQVKTQTEVLRNRGLDNNIQSITADNSGNDDIIEFIQNINSEAPKLTTLLGSPSIGTGLSIDTHNFQKTFGYFSSNSGTAAQAHQQLARARGVTEYHVYIDPTERHELINEDEIRRLKILEPCAETAHFLGLNDQGEVVAHPNFEWLYCKLVSVAAQNRNQFKRLFIEQAEAEGYTIVEVEKDSIKCEEGALDCEIAHAHLDAQVEREITGADLLTDDQYDLAMQGEGDYSHAALLKSQIYREFNFAEADPATMMKELNDLTIAEEQDKVATQLKKLSVAALPGDTTRIMDMRNRKHATTLADHKHYSKRKKHLTTILAAIGLDEDLEYDGRSWSNDVEPQLRKWLGRNKDALYKYSGITVSFNMRNKPLRWLNGMLRNLGLVIKSDQKRVDGERKWFYRLDRAHLKRVRTLIQRRNKGIIEHYQRADEGPVGVTRAASDFYNNQAVCVTPGAPAEPSVHGVSGTFEEPARAPEFSDNLRTPEEVLSPLRDVLNRVGVTIEKAVKLVTVSVLLDLAEGVMSKLEFSAYLSDALKREQAAPAG